MNSLYGRFGMLDSFPNIDIMDISDFIKFEEGFSDDIMDFIELDNKIMVIHRSHQIDVNTLLNGHKENHNVSIAIASAITAYARIHMSQFKNNPNFNLYYSDTDSAYVDKPLPKDMISSTVLGKMKLEHVLNDAILFHSFKK
jgi:DNA polymerase type B, organellar and viral